MLVVLDHQPIPDLSGELELWRSQAPARIPAAEPTGDAGQGWFDAVSASQIFAEGHRQLGKGVVVTVNTSQLDPNGKAELAGWLCARVGVPLWIAPRVDGVQAVKLQDRLVLYNQARTARKVEWWVPPGTAAEEYLPAFMQTPLELPARTIRSLEW